MNSSPLRPFFNPHPRIEKLDLSNGQCCYVVDDVLLEPERLVAWADTSRSAFKPVDFSAYPGQFVILPADLDAAASEWFTQHMRPLFDARRLIRMHARLSMVTLPPEALRPAQWLCHSDHFGLEPTQSIQASVLYLFREPGLGGTGFYEPTRPAAEIRNLFGDAIRLSADTFAEHHGIEAGYMIGSNRYFNRIGGVAARWNRMVFYDGTILHSGDIVAPEKLNDDPFSGRLTLNGFYTCRRRAS